MTRLLPIYPEPRKAPAAGPPIELFVDGRAVQVASGATLREACESAGVAIPTLCFAPNLTPVNVCRVCVVELEGARTLVPSCSRVAEAGMRVTTNSPRVRTSRKIVLELLAGAADLSATPDVSAWMRELGADAGRFVGPAPLLAAKRDNDLFVRDYQKCILCYKCVEACGADAQNTFAITVAGRGEHAHIATEFDVTLPDSACVFCGNCVGACPTGALVFTQEYDHRQAGTWDESRQRETTTTCPYCGVGCQLTLRTQDDQVVRVTSPADSSVTQGNLCIKGRFGWGYVGAPPPETE